MQCDHPKLDPSFGIQTSSPPRMLCPSCEEWVNCGHPGDEHCWCGWCGERDTVEQCRVETSPALPSGAPTGKIMVRNVCSACGKADGPTTVLPDPGYRSPGWPIKTFRLRGGLLVPEDADYHG